MNYVGLQVNHIDYLFDKSKGKDKGIPIISHEGPREMWMQGSTYLQPRHKEEEVGWLALRSAVFTPGKAPVYSFL